MDRRGGDVLVHHDVLLDSGATSHNPMRVVPNGDGSEVVFTLLRLPGTSDDQFVADAGAVERDLRQLKILLEA
jgi:hypothetical protein